MFNEIDEMKSGLNAMLRPNGSQQAPARSCYDLFLCNPSFEEGKFYMLPSHPLKLEKGFSAKIPRVTVRHPADHTG